VGTGFRELVIAGNSFVVALLDAPPCFTRIWKLNPTTQQLEVHHAYDDLKSIYKARSEGHRFLTFYVPPEQDTSAPPSLLLGVYDWDYDKRLTAYIHILDLQSGHFSAEPYASFKRPEETLSIALGYPYYQLHCIPTRTSSSTCFRYAVFDTSIVGRGEAVARYNIENYFPRDSMYSSVMMRSVLMGRVFYAIESMRVGEGIQLFQNPPVIRIRHFRVRKNASRGEDCEQSVKIDHGAVFNFKVDATTSNMEILSGGRIVRVIAEHVGDIDDADYGKEQHVSFQFSKVQLA
jgi:hypothetical protein